MCVVALYCVVVVVVGFGLGGVLCVVVVRWVCLVGWLVGDMIGWGAMWVVVGWLGVGFLVGLVVAGWCGVGGGFMGFGWASWLLWLVVGCLVLGGWCIGGWVVWGSVSGAGGGLVGGIGRFRFSCCRMGGMANKCRVLVVGVWCRPRPETGRESRPVYFYSCRVVVC